MGHDLLISVVWFATLIWALIAAFNPALQKLWFAALGTCVGVGAGFLPILLIRGPAGLEVMMFAGIAAATTLLVIYTISGRMLAAAVVAVVILLPIICRLTATPEPPSARASGVDAALRLGGEVMILVAPSVVVTLAFREIFALLDRYRSPLRA